MVHWSFLFWELAVISFNQSIAKAYGVVTWISSDGSGHNINCTIYLYFSQYAILQ